jgi:RHS repeat-associated protein
VVASVIAGLVLLNVAGSGVPGLPDRPAGQTRQGAPPAPQQRAGSAAGRAHLVGRPGNHTEPKTLRSQYPLWSGQAAPEPAANRASVVAAPQPAPVTGFDPRTSRELPERRGAYQRGYRNADGTETTEISTSPVNVRRPDGSWSPVETNLLADGSGGWRNAAGAIDLRLAGRADAETVAQVDLGPRAIGFGLAGAAGAAGRVAGDTVSYPQAWPEVDVRLQSVAGGVKETLVLRSAQAARSFRFRLSLTGLTASVRDGQVVFTDAAGAIQAEIPAGSMSDAASAMSSGVRYSIAGGVLEVTLDDAWLSDPARRYPVLVDPSVLSSGASSSMVVHGSSSSSGSSELLVGNSGGSAAASYLKFDGLVDQLRGHTIYGAQLSVVNFDSPSCKARPVSVHPVTESWSVGSGYSYPGPSVGSALTSKSFAYGYFALGQSKSACPVQATLFNLGNAGRKLVQDWADGKPAYGLSLRASASDSGAWKRFAGSGTANPPRLYVTHSPYNAKYSIPKPVPEPPVLQNQSGRVKVTVTNLSAESWTPANYYLAYRAYNAQTSRAVTQQRSASLPGTVARGAKVTLDAEIKPLPPGRYYIDFTMVRTGGVVFTDEQVPPARMVLEVIDIPPVVQEVFPPNGYQAPTLTPQLWARALDIDAPAGSALQYKFEVCDSNGAGDPVGCTTSAYQTSPAWTVPAGRLVWSKDYVWRAFVKDANNEVASPRSTIVAAVPQPAVTSRLAGAPYGSQEREFDPQLGNFSTAAVDATVTTVGPELNLVRTYNSLDPRRAGLFGAGWSTRYDIRLVPDGDGSGNVVVTYPDGQEVRFGRNPDGTFAPPPGRSAALSNDSTGWRLVDKSGAVYSFAGDGRLTRIADAAARAVVLTYNSNGTLARAQVSNSQTNTAGRSLRFTWTGSHVTAVTNDANQAWTYSYTGDLLSQVCAPGPACTSYSYTPGSLYRTAVLDDRPESYYRLGDDGSQAGSEVSVNLGKDAASYTGATTGSAGALAGTTDTAVTFNGTSSRMDLPKGAVKKSRDAAVELWFKSNPAGSGGPLLGYQDKAVGQTSTVGVPVLYVGTDGRLRGQLGTGSIAPVASTTTVNDGKWHHAALSVMGGTQTLYLDGASVAAGAAPSGDPAALTVNQVGAAYASTPASWPAWGTAAQRFYNGTIDEVALYAHPLGPAAVAAHYRYGSQAAGQLSTVTLPSGKVAAEAEYDPATARVSDYTDSNGGTWHVGAPVVYGGDTDLRRGVEVRDPAGRLYLYEYDALAGRVVRTGTPAGLGIREEDRPGEPSPSPNPSPTQVCTSPDGTDPGFCTVIPGQSDGPIFSGHPLDGMGIRTFSYDEQGYQSAVTNENGDTVWMTYDARGNLASRKTCRNLAADCHTEYTTYPAAPTDPLDPRNEMPTETRDARSASPTDNTYRTSYTYSPTGELATQSNPDGGVVRHTYTTGGESAVGGGAVPPGLPLTSTDARGAGTRYGYFTNGDLASLTEPSGLVTTFTYDALGRKLTDTEKSDTFPNGVTTSYTYDALSRVLTTTEPAAGGHQARTTNTYDLDGNLLSTAVNDLIGGEPARLTRYEYDEHNRLERETDPEGNETSYGYDQFGNRTSMVDALGNRYEYGYTARNMPAETRLRTQDGEDLVLGSLAYDFAGRKVRETDAMGRDVVYAYYSDDLVKSVTLKGFHNPDGSTRDFVLESDTYDGAGNLTRQVTGNGRLVTEYAYDRSGQQESTVVDPGGLAQRTAYSYDANGNVTRVSRSGLPSNVPWTMSTAAEVVENGYDLAGRKISETEIAGTTKRTTQHGYDQRGLLTSVTDARGNVTTYTYDETGLQTSASGPAVDAGRPVMRTGYNTFGEVVSVTDPLGNVTRTDYDRVGRPVRSTEPTYNPPGGITTTPSRQTRYDALGHPVEEIDPRGNSTRYTYDQLGRLVTLDQPSSTADERAVTSYTYTLTDQVLSVTDPTGARTELTYDDLDRKVTETQLERRPVAGTFVTRYTYDDTSNLTAITSPTGASTVNTYDVLGQLTRSTDPSGVPIQYGYDFSGRQVRLADGAGRTSRTDYDGFGEVSAESDLDSNGTVLRSQSYEYDAAGNLAAATDPLGNRTSYTYGALNQLTGQTEPGPITTSFGYDLAGNRTSYTDGRGNTTRYTVNTLGLPESVIEPATTAQPAAADRTWTASYDAAGNTVRLAAPGGVTRQRTFDAGGRMTAETGDGAEAGTAGASLGYNLRGELVSVNAPSGTNIYSYDDRGNPLAATGPSGNASFSYDADSAMLTRTDASGTARYKYVKGRLDTVTDGITGTAQKLGYDGAGLLATSDYGSGRVRSFGYDALGRIASDKLVNAAGHTVSSITYGYDNNDHLTSKVTTGTAGAGSNTYGYDATGRLSSWTGPKGTTTYDWDAAGNRVRAGDKSATYDERNRLLSDGDYTYGYSPRGTVRSRTSSGMTEQFSFDAFDRLISEAGSSYSYDGLDRVASRNGAAFGYGGQDDDVVSDGQARFAYGPDGDLLATALGDAQRLTLSDKHADAVADFAPSDTTLDSPTDSVAYDPFGEVTDESGEMPNVGFQGDWTDPDTGQVNMGARWYDPGTGTFDSRDSVNYSGGDSVLANRYAYGADAPLDATDPDGQWPCFSCAVKKVGGWVAPVVRPIWSGIKSAWSGIQNAWNYVSRAASWLYHKAKSIGSSIVRHVGNTIRNVWNKTAPFRNWAKQRAAEVARRALAVKHAITKAARKAAAAVAKSRPFKALKAAVKPVLSGVKTVIRSAAHVAAQAVAVVRDVVHDVAKTVNVIYHKALDAASSVVSAVTTAVKTVSEFAQAALPMVAGIAAGLLTTGGCLLATGGAGSAACVVAGFAVGSAVTSALSCPPGRSIAGCAARGAVAGAVGGAVFVATGGTGGGLSAAIIAGGLSAGASTATEDVLTTGHVDPGSVLKSAVVSGATAGILHGARVRVGGRGCNSFEGQTAVLMADGSHQAIQHLKVGDLVLATDPTTGRTERRKVTEVIVGEGDKQLVQITVDGGSLVATQGHPFWVESLHRWVNAEDLKPGYTFETADHRPATVAGTRTFSQRDRVYNLTVDGLHTYYAMAGNTPVLVHNADCRGISGWTRHGAEQAEARGISEDMAENAVRTGRPQPGNRPGTTKYTGRNVWVVLNNACEVVSCGWNGRR